MHNLQRSLQQTGKHYGWDVWCLGDAPESTVENLISSVSAEDYRFGVIVINAHGNVGTWGVRLARQQEWRGDFTDLTADAERMAGRQSNNPADALPDGTATVRRSECT